MNLKLLQSAVLHLLLSILAVSLALDLRPSWPLATAFVAVVMLIGGLAFISRQAAGELDALRAQVEEAKKDAARALSAAAAAKGPPRGY